MTRKIEVRLDQEYARVVQDGRTLSPGASVTMTAADLAVMVRDHAWAYYEAAAKAYAQGGVQAGAEYALAHSTRRTRVERDAKGQITGTVSVREPLPPTPKPAEKPAKKPIGFHPR